jgi:hypothetical protein
MIIYFRQDVLADETLAAFYQISSAGPYGMTRYGLRLPPEKIIVQDT